MLTSTLYAGLVDVAGGAEGLRLLVLFGSRARDDARVESDWDFGYIGTSAFDADGLLATLVGVLGTDRIDLVDLTRAGGQLRYRAARDGMPLSAADDREFAHFWFEAVSFWCDMQSVLRAGYEQVLSELPQR